MASTAGGAIIMGILLLMFLSVGTAHNSRRLFLETREGSVATSPAPMHIQPIDHPKYEALNVDWSDENGKQDTEAWFPTSLNKYGPPLHLKGPTFSPRDGIYGIAGYQRAQPTRANAIQDWEYNDFIVDFTNLVSSSAYPRGALYMDFLHCT